MVDSADAATAPTDRGDAADGPGRRGRGAAVIGGSLAGLLTARVLADHCDRVTVIERDRLPSAPERRAGVPQDRHTHVLLRGGQQALEELLPGLTEELLAHGAPRVGMPEDMVQWQSGNWFRRTPATAHLLTASRPLLEWLVRRRVLADPRVETVQGTEVVGLAGTAARTTGVLLRERGAAASGATRTVAADLVVDASGRGSRAAAWLTALGADPAPEETLDTGLAYTSRLCRGPSGAGPARVTASTDALGYYVVPQPDQVYGAVVLPTEGDRWLVTLSGLRGSEPPVADEAFTAFAERLPHPFVHAWLREAEPVGPPHGYRNTANVRRRYDRPGRRPAGFLAVGDALCAFNPIYGQGMAVAAQSALALRGALTDRGRTPTTRRVQRALARAAQQAWDISAGADKKMPGAVGNAAGTRAADRPVNWYLARVQQRAGADPVVSRAFRSALDLSAPLTVLFTPRVARAVLLTAPAAPPAEPPWWRETGDAGTPG